MSPLPPPPADGRPLGAEGAVVVAAPAKVNLHLHVVGRRPDGYHLLDSLIAFAGVHDDLLLEPADGLSLSVAGPNAPALATEDDNIVLRAARALALWAGVEPRARITLTKRLPVAAGIGGGSADAAAVLRGLDVLWGLNASEADLERIGLSLGADVPVCVRGRPTTLAGIGEALSDAPALPPAWLLLVNPGVALSTPSVFRARSGEFSQPAPLLKVPADAGELASELARRRNDLSAPALSLQPVVGEVLAALSAAEGCLLARMSGSGATCFGLFATRSAAEAAAARIGAARPGWWVAPAPLVARA